MGAPMSMVHFLGFHGRGNFYVRLVGTWSVVTIGLSPHASSSSDQFVVGPIGAYDGPTQSTRSVGSLLPTHNIDVLASFWSLLLPAGYLNGRPHPWKP
jgi:hypothetical protein